MPLVRPKDSEFSYYLINYDKDGKERKERGKWLSDSVIAAIELGDVTDVFVMCHGWRGDIPSAKRQYDAWTTNLMSQEADIQAMRDKHPAFKPLLVGLHWPSEPFGNEDIDVSYAPAGPHGVVATVIIEDAVVGIALKLGDTSEAVREQLRIILRSYAVNDSPPRLPPEVNAAYKKLERLLKLKKKGVAAAPGEDLPAISAAKIYQNARQQEITALESFGWVDSLGKAFLAPLRVLSYWSMKARARDFGEGGARDLLRRMHTAGKGYTRFHLMGHSFGCIVVTGMAGAKYTVALPIVSSLVLVQGALSLWAYCENIPVSPGKAGYFSNLMTNSSVYGPIVVTTSQYDRAIRGMYPLVSAMSGSVAFKLDEFPKFGGVGVFGIQGLGTVAQSGEMLPAAADYNFKPKRVYNLDSSNVISGDNGQRDAHSDIVHPEVAHVIWEAAK